MSGEERERSTDLKVCHYKSVEEFDWQERAVRGGRVAEART
jgi:hypothetical protein